MTPTIRIAVEDAGYDNLQVLKGKGFGTLRSMAFEDYIHMWVGKKLEVQLDGLTSLEKPRQGCILSLSIGRRAALPPPRDQNLAERLLGTDGPWPYLQPSEASPVFTHSASYIYIYIIYTPNLGLRITVFDREREQGRFRGSTEGAWGSTEGALRAEEGRRG